MTKRTFKLLLIEDDELDFELVTRMLDSNEADSHDVEFDVTWSKYLRDGLQQLAEQKFDVVLLDLRLPDCAGIPTLERVLETSPEAVVVVLTGTDDEQVAVQAARQGAQDYLNKSGLAAAQLVRSLLYAIERHERLSAQRKLRAAEQEFAAAGAVQRLLLPSKPPQVAGLDIAGGCWPFEHVGGDYYDYFEMGNGQLGIAIADVSGHGLASALVMAGLRRLLRSSVEIHDDVAKIMTIANRAVCHDTREEQFVTAFFATLDAKTRELSYSAAGHEGYVIQPSGEVRRLEGANVPLGVENNGPLKPGAGTNLNPGEIMFLMTDGVFESTNLSGQQFGIASVLSTVHQHCTKSADEIVGRVCESVHDFCKPKPPSDDMAVVVVKVLDQGDA